MKQASSQSKANPEQKGRPEQSPLVLVARTFHAPINQVWTAWSEARLIRQWWGPQGFTSPGAQTDFRVGGEYLFAMQAPDGQVVWSGGKYEEILPNKKIVYTDHFANKDGDVISPKEAGMNLDWPNELRVTVEFESINPFQTKMVLRHEGIPEEMHDDCTLGWSQSIDKLQRLVE